jgi:hypothetical protein
MLLCRVLGHRHRFTAAGPELSWTCARGCGAGGSKEYASEADAARYAHAFDREDSAAKGGHAPPLGMFPLWIVRAIRSRRERAASG